MLKKVLRSVVVAGAALAVSVAIASPASAVVGLDSLGQADTLVPVPTELVGLLENESGLSQATQDAWDSWNEGGGLVGQGAAQLVSGAWIGVPHSILDLVKEDRGQLSQATQDAWDSWNEGGGMLGQGAAQLVSGAWIGVPHSILDIFERFGGSVFSPLSL